MIHVEQQNIKLSLRFTGDQIAIINDKTGEIIAKIENSIPQVLCDYRAARLVLAYNILDEVVIVLRVVRAFIFQAIKTKQIPKMGGSIVSAITNILNKIDKSHESARTNY